MSACNTARNRLFAHKKHTHTYKYMNAYNISEYLLSIIHRAQRERNFSCLFCTLHFELLLSDFPYFAVAAEFTIEYIYTQTHTVNAHIIFFFMFCFNVAYSVVAF